MCNFSCAEQRANFHIHLDLFQDWRRIALDMRGGGIKAFLLVLFKVFFFFLLVRLYSGCPILIAKYPAISFMNMLIYVREAQILSMPPLPLIRSKESPS